MSTQSPDTRLDRGTQHFFAQGSKLVNEAGDDRYPKPARQTLTAAPAVESVVADPESRLF